MAALAYLFALTAICGAVFSLGGFIEYSAPRAFAMRRLFRRRGAARRRKLAFPDGAIVRCGIDRLRLWVASTRQAIGAPWSWLCARIADGRLRKLAAHEARPRELWAVIDYSTKRARALEQLGDGYLLAKPVKRTYPYERGSQ